MPRIKGHPFVDRLAERASRGLFPSNDVIAAGWHHTLHGDYVRTSNGNQVCGLERCALHYPPDGLAIHKHDKL
jgi:hypothetical protein